MKRMKWIITWYCARHRMFCPACIRFGWDAENVVLNDALPSHPGFLVGFYVPVRAWNGWEYGMEGLDRFFVWFKKHLIGLRLRR